MQHDAHTSFIVAAYVVAGLVIGAMIVSALVDYRVLKRQLAAFGSRGIRE